MNFNEWQPELLSIIDMVKVSFAYVKGKAHIKKGTQCQDYVACLKEKNVVILALADGAGSSKHSEIGANAIVNEINKCIGEHFSVLYKLNKDMLQHYLSNKIKQKLMETSFVFHMPIADLSSTLLFVATDEKHYLAGHIGDGIIGILPKNAVSLNIQVLSFPENGEFYNETFFTTARDVKQRLRIYKGAMDEIEGFILMSDGTSESLFNRQKKEFAPAVSSLFKWLQKNREESVSEALQKNLQEKISDKTSDDCSIGLILSVP